MLERQAQLIQEFQSLATWEDRYKLLIDKGKKLAVMDESLKTEDAKIRGCQSQVWLQAKLNSNGKIEFEADSDAMIVKGLVAVLLQVYSRAEPDEILQAPPDFLKQMGFETHLSPSRANGLYAMIKQIRLFATAFKYAKTAAK